MVLSTTGSRRNTPPCAAFRSTITLGEAWPMCSATETTSTEPRGEGSGCGLRAGSSPDDATLSSFSHLAASHHGLAARTLSRPKLS